MSNSSINISNYENALSNPYYIADALENSSWFNRIEKKEKDIIIEINDVSMSLASGYGTWCTSVTLIVMGVRKIYTMTHHNEDWYSSQHTIYNDSANSDDEAEDAVNAFQCAFESVIDRHIDNIVEVIELELESEDDE